MTNLSQYNFLGFIFHENKNLEGFNVMENMFWMVNRYINQKLTVNLLTES